MLRLFRRDDKGAVAAKRLYDAVVAQARSPVFHRSLNVPDTIDGRFDLLVLHLYLVLDRLTREGGKASDLAQALTTMTFAGFDGALRDLGVSDVGLARKLKAMANAYYGRFEAYSAAGDSEEHLAATVLRNIYRGDETRAPEAARLARYVAGVRKRLRTEEATAKLVEGNPEFGPPPEE
jgi:cytochrome b pre-mRNA-processing protein 3